MSDWIYKWRDNGWINSAGNDVANKDLIQEASYLNDRLREEGDVEYVWIPRHHNEAADAACKEALDEQGSDSE